MIALANDHAGVALKEEIKKLLDSRGLAYKDLGTNTTDSVDYPVYGEAAARAVASGKCDRAIIICGTGLGISMAANKVRGIRAAVCTDCFMAEMARCIGEEEKAASYEALCDQIKKVWNETFLEPETCITHKLDGSVNDTQASYALPLEYDVILPENLDKVRANLKKITEKVGHTVTTGFVGTGPLNPALTEAGFAEDAYKLINQTAYPSWLYPVTQGATTIWERWNSYTVENGFGGNNAMNSFNHYSLGAVAAWIYGYVLGIHRGPSSEGSAFRHFLYQPYIGGFDHAEGHYDSIYGRIESRWACEEGRVKIHFTVPVGSTATVKLPGEVLSACGLEFTPSDGWQCAEAVSGMYDVEIEA